MMNIKQSWLAVALAALAGCGSGDGIKKVVVHGEVQFDGKPLPHGQILFYPLAETRGPVSTASINDGKFVAKSKGGVPVGKHQVKIEGYRRPTTAPPGVPIEDLGRVQYLPAKYNNQTELTTELTEDESPAIRDYSLNP
jgi:hypothetical protein